MVTDTDVIIIGAGIAGLNAAKSLVARGIDHIVLEASHRIGGRAYSEAFADGSWFDLGCSYLHEGEINPLRPIAEAFDAGLGDGTRFDPDRFHLHAPDDLGLTAAGYRAYAAACDERMQDISGDTDMGAIMDWDSAYAPFYAHLMAGLNGSDVTEQSVMNYLASGFGLDIPLKTGLGSLIARWGADVPVRLNCAVEAITWRTGHVRVDTANGHITAKRLIVTVSTGILNAGQIRFDPLVPEPWASAMSGLPCGTLNKIGIAFQPNSFARDDAGWHSSISGDGADDIASFDINLDGHEQVIFFAGGSFGIHLEKRGPAAMQDYAFSALESVFGSAIHRQITGCITTAWAGEPLTIGSYSYAMPGHDDARTTLSAPIEGTIIFAGEATSGSHYGTAHGAFLEGARAAQAIRL